MSNLSSPTLPITATVNPLPTPDPYTIQSIAALVRDLAVNMYDIDYILKKHRLTQDEYEGLCKNEFFKRALEVAATEWHSPLSTNKRLAMQAAIGLEDAMPKMAARMHKESEPLANIVEVARLFAKIAGAGEEKTTNIPSEKFTITINLGADTEHFEKTRPTLSLQPQSKGENENPQIFALPKGSGESTSN